MPFDIGVGELIALAVIAMLVLGPDKLPKFAADAARMLRQLRTMANAAKEDVRRELGPELQNISLDDLNPRSLIRKHVLDDLDLDGLGEDPAPRNGRSDRTSGAGTPGNAAPRSGTSGGSTSGGGTSGGGTSGSGTSGGPAPYDPDAT